MKWLYLIAGSALFLKFIFASHAPGVESDGSIMFSIISDSGVPNAVAGVIFRNRLYDTIFEVIVFTMTILGAQYLLEDENPHPRIRQFKDAPSILLARLGATITALVAFELAIRGHLSPGGGFAAGVAGGTAIGLAALTALDKSQKVHRSSNAVVWEKVIVLAFIVLSVLTLTGIELPRGSFGSLLSGGGIPVMNVLVAIKVMLGAWALLMILIRYRGLL
ncbi:MAG: cation:proton antiporter [Chitinivibrionales bacterium]|nr:cation:proton antiporter [Chitinivibrionales bacterium]